MEKLVIPEGYKQTEVGVIPNEWEASSIGQVTIWSSGGTPSRARDDYWQGDIPWISGSTLKHMELDSSDQFLTNEGVNAGSKMAPLNSTLLLVRGSALHSEIRAGLVVVPLCFNQDVKALTPVRGLVPKYLTIYLLAMESELLKLVSSAGNSAGVLDTELVKNFKFLCPPIEEQTAIANALSDVDALIAELEKLIVKKEAIKTATMQQLLTGRTRLPEYANHPDGTPKGYKQTELGEIPEDWGTSKLGLISDKITVGIASSATHAYRNKGIPFIRNQNIKPNRLDCSDLLYISAEYEKVFVNKRLKSGDLLTARTGYPGTTCEVPSHLDGAQSFTTLITRLKKESVNPSFLTQYINSEIGHSFFEKNQIGGGQKNVNAATLRQFEFSLPIIEEQTAIANILSDMDEEIQSLQQRLDKTRQIKQGMMQELLTGKTRLV